MQENKYFYKGIPLSEYCKDNDININSIRSRIWKKKHNKKIRKLYRARNCRYGYGGLW